MYWMRTSFIASLHHIPTSRSLYTASWSFEEQHWIDAAFYWSFTCAQIPGALLTLKFSSHRVLLVSVLLTAVLHIILPFVFSGNAIYVIIFQVLQGIAEGPLYPACTGIWKLWAPPSEKTRLFCIVLCGSFFGGLAGLPLNIVLADNFGTTSCFFISAISGLVWCFIWALQMHESPSSHPHISHSELSYLEESIDVDDKLEITVRSVPWISIFRSLPVWTVLLASIYYFFSQYFLLFSPYTYYGDELEFEKVNTILDAVIPNIILGTVTLLSGFLADLLINYADLPRTSVRKLFCCGAFTLHSIALLVVRYYRNVESTVICINLAHGFLGLSLAGFWLNCLDFSPYYASVVMALSQTFGNICYLITPVILNALWGKDIQWSSLFDALITMSFIVSLIYAIFGSGDVQWWGKPEPMNSNPSGNESLRSTYYSYPDDADCVELVGDFQQLSDANAESEKERY